jgi:tetratricopeptide (TPR) repeat protein
MATKKKAANAGESEPAMNRTQHHEAYDKAVEEFGEALARFNKGEFEDARERFERIAAENMEERVLADRALSYAAICRRKLLPPEAEPRNAEERYLRAVMCINEGNSDAAVKLLDQCIAEEPSSSRFLYARSSAWALSGKIEAAINDLRQAISIDPQVRFQAVNDPDFESIREEPAFIDIIEPTPTGA